VNEEKLELRAKKCIFLSYDSGVKEYRLWCPDSKRSKFLISRNVIFDETKILKAKESQLAKEPIKEAETVKEKVNFEISNSNIQPSQVQPDDS
jgi:hypothetical protein